MKQKLRRKLEGTNVRQFTVYLPEELDLWLRSQAHEQGRTLTKQTEFTLRAGREAMSCQGQGA
jgi:hypothetical protein